MEKKAPLSLDLGKLLSLTLGGFLGLLVIGGGLSILRYKSYRANVDDLYNARLRTLEWVAESDKNINEEDSRDNTRSNDPELEQILTSLDNLTKKSFSNISQEALFLKGMIYHAQNDDTQASAFFENSYKKDRRSLLGNKAALNAAAAYENMEDLKSAKFLYAQIAKQKKFSNFSQEATFHLGRVTEALDDVAALEIYRTLIDKVEDGNFWRALAENRSLILETQM